MCLRRQRSRAPVKELHSRLQHAYQRDAGRLVRRTTVWRDLLVHQVPVEGLRARWGLSPSCLYHWRQAFLLRGMESLASHQRGGRRPKLPPRQQKRWLELREAGPQVGGGATACWTAVLMRGLLGRAFGVLDNCQSVGPLRPPLGCSLPQARFVSAHLDAARRQAWLQEGWPMILRAAKRRKGRIRFEEEASFAQWGA